MSARRRLLLLLLACGGPACTCSAATTGGGGAARAGSGGARVFNVLDFGAKGDGVTNDHLAIAQTFAACRRAVRAGGGGAGGGGAEVVFPAPGRYVTGPWEIACNDSLVRVERGASVVSFTANGSTVGWPIGALDCPEPSQGLTSKQAAPFILAHYARNVTLTGGGTLDAGGKPFWHEHCGNWWCPKWSGATPKQPYAWRPFMLRIDHSSDVTVDNLRFESTAFWCIVPVHSSRVEISNVTVYARDDHDGNTPNTDGVEPMWSTDVHIHDCVIDNGDDCVTVKSGSSNVLVERLDCTHSHGITIGSVWYDDVTNVTYRDVTLHGTTNGPRIKGRRQGNATISDITFQNIRLDDVHEGIGIEMTYETPGSTADNIGCVAHNVSYINVTGTASSPGQLECLSTRPCSQVEMSDVDVEPATHPWECHGVKVQCKSVKPAVPKSCVAADRG